MYYKTFYVNGYPFIAAVEGLIIDKHPIVDESYKETLEIALELFDAMRAMVTSINGGDWHISTVEDAKYYARTFDSLSDYAGDTAMIRVFLEKYDIQIPPDVALLSAELYKAIYEAKLFAPPPDFTNEDGQVYLIQAPNGAYKIGRTKNIKDRLRTFGVKLPFEIEFIHVIHCADYVKTELRLHERFANKRMSGEWFALTAEDIEWFKSIRTDDQL